MSINSLQRTALRAAAEAERSAAREVEMNRYRLLGLMTLLVVSCGCHTMRFDLSNAQHEKVVYERKSFFLWGLVPTREIDTATRCPAGAAAIRERTTFTDGLLGLITLGIWQPRSTWYYCLPRS
jgi:hypothetical protein